MKSNPEDLPLLFLGAIGVPVDGQEALDEKANRCETATKQSLESLQQDAIRRIAVDLRKNTKWLKPAQ
jgi:hypothetical protein